MKLRKINEVSLTATDINIGDTIKVGSTANLIIDKIPEELQKAFEKMREIVKRQTNNTDNAKLLKQQNITMSQFLFTHLFVFAKVIAETFPNLGCRDNKRQSFYAKNTTAKLSDCAKIGATNSIPNSTLMNLFTSFSKSTLTMLIINNRMIKLFTRKIWP